jgi:hypothetical protein
LANGSGSKEPKNSLMAAGEALKAQSRLAKKNAIFEQKAK